MFDLQDAKLEESTGELKTVEGACIRELAAFEEDVGLQVITAGEFRRNSWAYDFIAMIDGIELKPQEGGAFQAAFGGSGAKSPVAHAVGKVKRRPGGLHLPDYLFLKDLTDRTIKVPGRRSTAEARWPYRMYSVIDSGTMILIRAATKEGGLS